MYKDFIWQTCEKCHETCASCKGSRTKDCLSCVEDEKELTLIFGYCTQGCPSGYIREKGGIKCINFQACFDSVILSTPKIFSITDQDFSASLKYKLKESCLAYENDLSFVWDEVKDAKITGPDFLIPNQSLESGNLKIGVFINYNDVGIKKIEAESMLVTYKVNKIK